MLRKIFAAAGIAFLMTTGAAAFENSFFSMEITPSSGLLNGTIREYVIDSNCLNTDNIESRLDWDVQNIPFFSADADFYFWGVLHANVNFSVGIPKGSGSMQDYDWLNSLYPAWADDAPTALTNYSKSDNKLDSYTAFGLRLGADIPLPLKLRLTPFIAYEYGFIGMTGYGGYYTYKNYNWEEKSLSGKVIAYKQEINSFLLGLGIKSDTIQRTFFQADFQISPFATAVNCLDIHYARSVVFFDNIDYALQLKGSASILYKFSEHHSAGLSGFIQYIPFCYGPDYSARVNSNNQIISEYKATWVEGGTDRILWSVSLVYRLSL